MRTTGVSVAVTVALIGGLTVGAGRPAAAGPAGKYDFCPRPIPIVNDSTVWENHRLAPGVRLAETYARGGRGRVAIDVVRADLTNTHVSLSPLASALTTRKPLTTLARHRTLVAATNGMYFNTGYGSPKVPFIKNGQPLVMSSTPEHVAGAGADGILQDGNVWLSGNVNSPGTSFPLSAINEPTVPAGISVYTQAWGHHRIPMPPNAEARGVVDQQVVTRVRQQRWLPDGGLLLVARGVDALGWLSALPLGARLTVSRNMATDALVPFVQGYGVGTQTVVAPGVVETDLYCRASERYAARTDIAWKPGGHTLMLVTVEATRASDHYGVDENQMSGLLVALGASKGFALDGGGSTQMVARLKQRITKHIKHRRNHHVVRRTIHRVVHRLVLQVHPRGSTGRAIPVGLGVYSDQAPS